MKICNGIISDSFDEASLNHDGVLDVFFKQEGPRGTEERSYLMVTGVIRSIVVTLSRNAEMTAVKRHNVVIEGHTLPLAILNARTDM